MNAAFVMPLPAGAIDSSATVGEYQPPPQLEANDACAVLRLRSEPIVETSLARDFP